MRFTLPSWLVLSLWWAAAPVMAVESLKEVLGPGIAIGAAIPPPDALTPEECRLLATQFSAVTPENVMKAEHLQPAEGVWKFARADALVTLAAQAGQTIHGHALVWHQQCPAWFFRDGSQPAGRDVVLQRLRTHIATVAGHFAGRLASWDVVNEAIDDGPAYLRPSPWLQALGPEFLAEAFLAARAADPKVALYYNDYNIEQPGKRAKTLRLIRDLRAAQAPIDGIGIQGHWSLDHIPYDAIEAAIVAFHAEGVRVAITELDIDVVNRAGGGADIGQRDDATADPFASGLPADRQQRLADQYARLFALFHKHRDKLSRITFWGLHDGRSWLNTWPRQRTNHPLLWDRALQPKPALSAILGLFRS